MARPFQMEDVPGLLQYKSSVGQGYGNLFNAHLLLLQEKLRKEGILFPEVEGNYAESLPPDNYRLHVGFDVWECDQNQTDIIKMMESVIRTYYRLSNYSKQEIQKLISQGIRFINTREFQDAMSCFKKAYYGASLNAGMLVERLYAMNNMALIYSVNDMYDHSFFVTYTAFKLSKRQDCYDPVAKYITANNHAFALAKKNRYEDAGKVYAITALLAKNMGDSDAQITALVNRDCCFLFQEKYEIAAEELEKTVQLMKTDMPSEKETIQELTELCVYAYKCSKDEYKKRFIEQLEINIDLQKKLKRVSLAHAVLNNAMSLVVNSVSSYFTWKIKLFDKSAEIELIEANQSNQEIIEENAKFFYLQRVQCKNDFATERDK